MCQRDLGFPSSATMDAMKIALLGAMGFVGQVAARELAGRQDVRELLLVDYNVREAKRFDRTLSPKCRWAMADVGRIPDLERLLGAVDAVANATGPCAEYEKGILLACAGSKQPAASIGDGVLSDADRREIHDAFRRAGAGAVSGCGLLPGWTDLLAVHFLPAARIPSELVSRGDGGKFLFCAPDRFGGYAFFRRVVRGIGRPPAAPAGGAGAMRPLPTRTGGSRGRCLPKPSCCWHGTGEHGKAFCRFPKSSGGRRPNGSPRPVTQRRRWTRRIEPNDVPRPRPPPPEPPEAVPESEPVPAPSPPRASRWRRKSPRPYAGRR